MHFFAVESIRLRCSHRASQTKPIVDEDRPVSRVYRDEQVAELEPEDERPIRPRIRGVETCVPSYG